MSASTQSATLDLGTSLGAYRLLDVLGDGAMGRVYRAEHTLLGRSVALKVLRSEFLHDAFVVQRFFSEARAVNQIRHPNIVEITDFSQHEGTAYFVMEHLEGTLLDDIGLPLPPARAVHIARQIAGALGAVHAAGFVHRDLKPENVMIVARPHEPDYVKLLDFGAAKINPELVPDHMPSQPLAIVGTPQYMSPEQARGGEVDGRSDTYALGVILYEQLCGTNPFQAPNPWASLQRQIELFPAPLSVSPRNPALDALVMRCLDKDPAARPDAPEMEAALAKIEEGLRGRGVWGAMTALLGG